MKALSKNSFVNILDKLLEWSLYITVLAVPLSKSIIEICISIGVVLLITKKIILKDFRLPETCANLPLLLVFITGAISIINSEFLSLSLRAIVSKNLKFIALYFVVVEVINTRTKIKNLLKMALLSAVVVFSDTLIQYFVTHADLFRDYRPFKYVFDVWLGSNGLIFTSSFVGYPTGPFPFPNDLSAWLLIVVPVMLCVSLFDLKKKMSRYPIIILSMIGVYILVLAKVRGAWLSFIISMSSLVFLVKKKMILVLILAVMFIIIVLSFANSWNVIFGFSTLADRGDMWTGGVKIFSEHPIIGNGINTFFNKFKYVRTDADRGKRGSYAHNCYLQMACDTGVLGLMAFLWFVFSIMRKGVCFLRNTKDEFFHALALGLITGLTAFLIHSFVDTNLYSLPLAALFWLTAGFLIALTKIEEPCPA